MSSPAVLRQLVSDPPLPEIPLSRTHSSWNPFNQNLRVDDNNDDDAHEVEHLLPPEVVKWQLLHTADMGEDGGETSNGNIGNKTQEPLIPSGVEYPIQKSTNSIPSNNLNEAGDILRDLL